MQKKNHRYDNDSLRQNIFQTKRNPPASIRDKHAAAEMALCKAIQGILAQGKSKLVWHVGGFHMEQQRLCPSLGHKEAQRHGPQAENSQWGWSPAQCRTLSAPAWGFVWPRLSHLQGWRPSPLSGGLSWVHMSLQGRRSPSPGSPFRASPETASEGRESPGSNPATQQPVILCPPLTLPSEALQLILAEHQQVLVQ